MLTNPSSVRPPLLAFLMISFSGFSGNFPTAMADQVIRTFPGGSAESLLSNTKDPDWKKQDTTKTRPSGTGVSVGLQCEIPDGRTVKQGEPGFDGCAAEKADAMSKGTRPLKTKR